MVVLSPSVSGIAVVPYTGKLPCGFMRPSRHWCGDSACPLNDSFLMAFAPRIVPAIVSCRRLWGLDENVPLLCCRLRVLTETVRITVQELEEGVVDGDAVEWDRLRASVNEHERRAIQLTSVGTLISFRDSPATMWHAESPLFLLPAGIELERPTFEHSSWWDAGLPDPDSLIEWDEEDEGDSE